MLVINQYYAPDLASTGQYAAEICEGLADRGFEVSVVAAQPCYKPDAEPAPEREVRGGVDVHRVPVSPFIGKETLVSRAGGYARFMLGAARKARSVAAELDPDAVLTFHNPPAVGLLGAHVSRRHDARYLYSPYDILPDVVLRGGWSLPDAAVRAWERMNAHIYEAADRVMVLGRGMEDVLAEEKGVPREKITPTSVWANPELDPSRSGDGVREELGIGDGPLFLYSGNMGYLHALEPLVEAAAEADLGDGAGQLVFVGRGPKRRIVEDALEERELPGVHLFPYQPKERFERLVAEADAAFVTLEEGMEKLAVPCRALTFLSGGTPLVVGMTGRGEIGRRVREGDCGWIVRSSDDLVDLTARLRADPSEAERKADNAVRTYWEHYGRDRTVHSYADVLTAAGSTATQSRVALEVASGA